MNLAERIRTLIISALMVFAGIIMITMPDPGYLIAILILSATLIVFSIRSLVFYFSMARHMVGGRLLLYIAIIMLDIGVFTLSLANVSKIIIILYLFGSHALSGGIDIMRALEAKKFGAPHWRFRLTYGIINIAVGVICVILINHFEFSVVIYALGLIFSAVSRVISVFRKTTVAYIQ